MSRPAERSGIVASTWTRPAASTESANPLLLIAQLGDRQLALPASSVTRVLRMAALTPLSDQSGGFVGVLNLHGDVLPVVDPRPRFHLPSPPPAPSQRLVVTATGRPFLVWFDRIDEVVVSRPEDFQPALTSGLPRPRADFNALLPRRGGHPGLVDGSSLAVGRGRLAGGPVPMTQPVGGPTTVPATAGALAVQRLVQERFGLRASDDLPRSTLAAIDQILASGEYPNVGALYAAMAEGSRDDLLVTVGESLLNGETHFFRVRPQIEALREVVIPALIARRQEARQLRVWSAGCSTGEEAFTIAILLREQLPELASWDVRILATDVNRTSLDVARGATFSEWSFRETTRVGPERLLRQKWQELGTRGRHSTHGSIRAAESRE